VPYYEFDQNNSGGRFQIDRKKGIGPEVWIFADSADAANSRAMRIGIYFFGGGDCECCGARWSEASEHGAQTAVEIGRYSFTEHDEIYVHEGEGFRIITKPE
jgi:hypothetical protein